MVKKAQSRVSLLIGGAALLVILILIAVWLWPSSGPPLLLSVSVKGTPAPGGTIDIVTSVTSDADRNVVLVAQLLTSTKQMVDIVRAQHAAPKGESEKELSIKLPAGLPQGRYTAQVTARFDSTKVVTAETSVRIDPAQIVPPSGQTPQENATGPPTPGDSGEQTPTPSETPVVPQENEPMPSTPPSTNPSELGDDIPSIEPVTQEMPALGAPMPMELEAVVTLAETNKDKALAECAKLPDANICLSRVAAALKDDDLCRSLQGFDADKCFLSVASAGKASSCASVQDAALRSTCEAVAKFGLPVEESA